MIASLDTENLYFEVIHLSVFAFEGQILMKKKIAVRLKLSASSLLPLTSVIVAGLCVW